MEIILSLFCEERPSSAFARSFRLRAAQMNQETCRHTNVQFPFLGRHSARGKSTACRQHFWAPSLRRKEKSVRRKAQSRFAGNGWRKFVRNMQRAARRKGPRLRKTDERVPRVVGRNSNRYCRAVPRGARLAIVEPPLPGQSQLEIVQRLIPGIFQDVVRFDSNARFRRSNKINLDLLFLDRVPGPQRSNARRRRKRKRSKQRHKREWRMESGLQNDSIVTGNASKKKLRVKN
jgi:hypothetical protein